MVPENSWKIESESDIDKYLNALKVSLEKEEGVNFNTLKKVVLQKNHLC